MRYVGVKVLYQMDSTRWSAQVKYASNRLVKVEFLCESNLRQDAEQKCRALFGTDDIRQLKREWS